MWLNVPSSIDCEPDTIRLAGFCSGTGMFEYAVQEALELRGYRAGTVVHCEREATAAAALVGIEAAAGRESLVWDDLSSFDGGCWRGLVDIAVAGLPCPAFSCAGKQAGNADERAWGEGFDVADVDTWGPQPHFLRVLDGMRPAMVFLENVSPWVNGGSFQRFGDALCRLGYEIEDPVFIAAEDVGASHKRERVFILAVSEESERWEHITRSRSESGTVTRWSSEDMADPPRGRERQRQRQCQTSEAGAESGTERYCEVLAQPGNSRRKGTQRGRASSDAGTGSRRSATEQCGDMGNTAGDDKRGVPNGEHGQGESVGRSSVPGVGLSECTRRATAGARTGQYAGCESQEAERGLGNAECRRRTDEDTTQGGQSCAARGRTRIPVFSPARNDYGAWAAVAGVDPSRMPAIESGVPVVADGMAFSNSDLLRLGGNGVVTLAAAVAFGALFDRVINEGGAG